MAESSPSPNAPDEAVGEMISLSELRHQRATEMSWSVWIVVDAHTRLILQSSSLLSKLTGYNPDEVGTKEIFQIIVPENSAMKDEILNELKSNGAVHRAHFKAWNVRGELCHFDLAGQMFEESGRKVIQFHLRAISSPSRTVDRETLNEESQRTRDAALSASAAKDRFLASLSHELRTPLNPALLLASENAANDRLSPEVRRDFDAIRKHIELEVHLIDDILDLTRVAQGKLALQPRLIDLHVVVREAITIVRAEIHEKQLIMAVQLHAEHYRVKGDSVRLQQVFWNLLRNAVKFTSSGGRISVESAVSADGLTWMGTIADTGIGLTEEEMTHIFDAFAQGRHANTSAHAKFGGLGLGLTISQNLIKLHGGNIRVSSAGKDQGATFVVELPLVRSESENPIGGNKFPRSNSSPPHINPPSERKRVLIVEDHTGSRIALAGLLERRGYEVVSAASRTAALQCAAAGHFDLLISDIGLPDGNGYELMTELHRSHGLRGIALTGYGMEEDQARSSVAGFFCHLTKPVSISSLATALSAFHAESVK